MKYQVRSLGTLNGEYGSLIHDNGSLVGSFQSHSIHTVMGFRIA